MRKITDAEGLRAYAKSRAPGDLDDDEFRQGLTRLMADVPEGLIAEYHFFDLPGNLPPWVDTGIHCAKGEQISLFLNGRIWMSQELDIWLHPHLWAWARIGEDGPVFRGTRSSYSFVADRSGPLYLGGSFPGEWTTPTGDLASHDAYGALSGDVTACVVRWAGDALEAVRMLARKGDVGGLLACEIDRLETEIIVPDDWHYPWNVGQAEAFAVQEGFPKGTPIGCFTKDEVISLNRDIDIPFRPGTKLAWSWKMDKLPSQCREDFLHTHDYIAVTAYFNNLKDLAYYWSAELPPDTAYQCPIPKWADLETHVVLRSGSEGLGTWVEEERDLYADYQRWIGTPPERITGVWLIALSAFRHGEGQAEIANIRLITDDGDIQIC